MAKTKKIEFKLDPEEMVQAGLHFGHRTSRVYPKMKPYIYGVRNTVHIIDLEKTVEKFREALKFIQELISENKILLLVGTKIQTKDLVESIAKECNLPYINERWLGGTFTNFETIKKRIEYFKDLEKKKAEGELEKYTKKERAKIDQELRGLRLKFGGIKNLERLPDAIFVLDMKKDALAIKEARAKGVKVIGVADTNVDPTLADYPIPANDDAISSIKYILEKVKEVILKAKK
jgi:small subunit ribosomal protein S2